MKAFKKVMCITLALLLGVLAFIMPVSAADTVPLVVVKGFAATTLYENYGTADQKAVFPPAEDDIEPMIVNILTSFITGFVSYGVTNDDWNKLADQLLPTINNYLEPLAYNADGTPKYDLGYDVYDMPMASYDEAIWEDVFTPYGVDYAETYGAENVYVFQYDWRKSPIDVATELDAFIEQVKVDTGADKVNLVAHSQGSCVALAYMDAYDCTSLNNVVFACPAWQGTSIAGSIATGNIKFDIFAVENFLVMLGNGSATTHLSSILISSIASYEGLSHEYFGKIDYCIQQLLPRIYSDTIIPIMAGMPGFWCLVPGDYYEAGKDYLYPDGVDANLASQIDAYNLIQFDAKSIVEKAEANGVKFSIVCGYNCQLAPINESYPTSDVVIDTVYASGGATCAKYLQAFDDWGTVYTQENWDGHNHVSWDQRIDASTCMFPEQTWFVKNLSHNSDVAAPIVTYLLGCEEQPTTQDNRAEYPQFFLYNTYTRTLTACPDDGILGDLDDTGCVTTKDARIGLKIAAGQVEPTEKQMILGDIDEDGEISSDDARSILCMAIGIDPETAE